MSRRVEPVRSSLSEPWRKLTRDRRHGATEVQRRALRSLHRLGTPGTKYLSEAELRWLRRWCREMGRVQPAMGGLVQLARSFSEWTENAPSPCPRGPLRRLVQRHERALAHEVALLRRTAVGRFPPKALVMTFSRSQAVLDLLRDLPPARRPQKLVVPRSTPGGEGRSLYTELRRTYGARVRLIDDEEIPTHLRGPSACVLVGADTIYSDGTLLHKVGTRSLARLAARRGVPFIALSPSSRILPWGPPRRGAWGRWFDLTPGRWVSEVWTERGRWRPGRLRDRLRLDLRRARHRPTRR
ncbi:MAG: hypothetical protein KGJ23_06975 [Euryarchaeota archaeon]|nr:hypothetical protein [Euryarchaeota archaeon]MDE1836342.1 hypothetical protein [Euryarchaeota archaeon]MDE1879140.1 hypothetical protein [Euryarchaeota archaeon]MDE2044262.1 hypothetical protein [Thermoplasmata archaeon]